MGDFGPSIKSLSTTLASYAVKINHTLQRQTANIICMDSVAWSLFAWSRLGRADRAHRREPILAGPRLSSLYVLCSLKGVPSSRPTRLEIPLSELR